jgi:hypothetical protein
VAKPKAACTGSRATTNPIAPETASTEKQKRIIAVGSSNGTAANAKMIPIPNKPMPTQFRTLFLTTPYCINQYATAPRITDASITLEKCPGKEVPGTLARFPGSICC